MVSNESGKVRVVRDTSDKDNVINLTGGAEVFCKDNQGGFLTLCPTNHWPDDANPPKPDITDPSKPDNQDKSGWDHYISNWGELDHNWYWEDLSKLEETNYIARDEARNFDIVKFQDVEANNKVQAIYDGTNFVFREIVENMVKEGNNNPVDHNLTMSVNDELINTHSVTLGISHDYYPTRWYTV